MLPGDRPRPARDGRDGDRWSWSRQQAQIEEELKVLLLPKDPNDDKNVVLEIRAGTGGDEATLFAAEIFRMYTRYAETQGWKLEVTSASESAVGGLKEVIALVTGNKVYSQAEVRERRAPRAARAGDRAAGARAHFGDHGGGAARSRRSGSQDRAQGHPDRHVLLLGSGRAERQHHVFGGAHHAPADRPGGVVPGRKIADQESRQGGARAALAAVRDGAGEAAGGARRGAPQHGGHGRPQREDPHLQLPAEPRHATTASGSPCISSIS